MLKDCRCGYCQKLLARTGEYTELQIKCSRCGTLNHVKAPSLERSPVSDTQAVSTA
ncbi:Com family DNA-binding transcriptional regulator [Pseudomonas baetica]|uniref:Com family DNA-binding transcriptional regulator n=1 Tax=Pseudomonas baetica TaxID=674054 RepID=UPI0024067939|nr:Com family DNA-binding transcriptional regulator [Pseudomonas baetica]